MNYSDVKTEEGSVFMPGEIAEAKGISWADKMLLSYVMHTYKEGKCYETNESLAETMGVMTATMKNRISKLKSKGYLRVDKKPVRAIIVFPRGDGK